MAGVIRSKNNPVIFLDFQSNKVKLGRMMIQLFADVAPKAAQNFRQFCTGEFIYKEKPAGYKDTCLHKIIPSHYFEGGDFIQHGVQTKSKISIYGYEQLFQDESFQLKHDEAGLLSMVSSGPNTNGNIFRITGGPCSEFDDKCVVFGKVIDESSLKIAKLISNLGVGEENRPKMPVVIYECGQM